MDWVGFEVLVFCFIFMFFFYVVSGFCDFYKNIWCIFIFSCFDK